MAQQQNISSEVLHTENFDSRSYVIGRQISRIFHPILLNIAAFIIVGFYAFDNRVEGFLWTGICMLTQIVPTTIFYTIRLRQGAYADEDVSVRQQRNELYLFGLATVLIGMVLLLPFGLPTPLLALLICGFALGCLGGLINLFWKISVHAASIASTATIAFLFSHPLGITLWLCALTVGWARVRTNNHTPLQVLGGFVMAMVVVVTVFSMLLN
ncbi:MAG: Membrane-associated phospholipid phosphatase [Chloroflexi bacterium AL-W]|nr:Membrane-associated phospholipid phosphatase [Chloroflexi bacterium AL-N1]NOK68431.1 Membrane-associated phospholipid phosphatase [Chloroflexi bacterium AL-N10]NOK74077.1 Membrane-associated phospholipid phosphatase [Chloroflexi bacterium AL-N5]NOK83044.1 Membrane-associated phospholipid phosphatase [Chloroflexi bacterium AL-W]NOK90567.1 Membrane-associated phospholipid phosphatase [Chloroflexi bacterium AL-N15]